MWKTAATILTKMQDKVCSEEGLKIYRKQSQTMEPVFGIIKTALGSDQFLRRGLTEVNDQ